SNFLFAVISLRQFKIKVISGFRKFAGKCCPNNVCKILIIFCEQKENLRFTNINKNFLLLNNLNQRFHLNVEIVFCDNKRFKSSFLSIRNEPLNCFKYINKNSCITCKFSILLK